MIVLVIGIFVLTLLGLTALFLIKAWEVRHSTVLMPEWRLHTDTRALALKKRLMDIKRNADRFGPILILIGRYLVHEGALALASFAHVVAAQAHKLADAVSHKHRFERPAPRSDFLKQVAAATVDASLSYQSVTPMPTYHAPASAPTHAPMAASATSVASAQPKAPRHRTTKKIPVHTEPEMHS